VKLPKLREARIQPVVDTDAKPEEQLVGAYSGD